jgi:regulator of cell morphogenesis and NO signaling
MTKIRFSKELLQLLYTEHSRRVNIMFLSSLQISPQSLVLDIVAKDYRAADVFKKYEIEYCCGGKWSLESICLMKGIRYSELEKELRMATRNLQLPGFPAFDDWSIDFLTSYIVNIHHAYLKKTLPELKLQLEKFVRDHVKKEPHLAELEAQFIQLYHEILPHLQEEEEIIFPYIKQVAHAFHYKDSYASLMVRTLRKPVYKLMGKEHTIVMENLHQFRKWTENYLPPEKACTNHRVIFARLKELDNDLVQHVYLENDLLFPKVLFMEQELLAQSG